MIPKFRIILGTGRCGTWTMYRVMQSQGKMVHARHEGYPLPWDPGDACAWYYWTLKHLSDEWAGQPYFAISSYAWVCYIHLAMKMLRDVRFVALKRPREEVIASFMKHWPTENYWTREDSIHWNDQWPCLNSTNSSPEQFRASFPQYDLPKEEAIGAYWDEYYERCEFWRQKLPDNVMVIDWRDALNTVEGQRKVLDFFGLPEHHQTIRVRCKLNSAENARGYIYREIGGTKDVPCRQIIYEEPEVLGSTPGLQV